MATHDPLASTIRYLRTAAHADHRVPLQDGASCPRCHGTRVQKWGRERGRQRFRCRDCARTFSTFTGTPLHYLKRPELWPRFLGCVEDRLSVRAAGELLGVDKDTTLRWRHRLLGHWREEPRRRLKGRLVIGDFCLPHADKGGRYLQRPPRHRGEPWDFPSFQTGPVTVLVAVQRPSEHWPPRGRSPQPQGPSPGRPQPEPSKSPPAMVLESVGVRRIRPPDYDHRVAPRVRAVTEIVGSRGPYCPLAGFAGRLGVPYRAESGGFFPAEVFLVRRGLRVWLRPFRGVSTRRLDNYLEWFRRRGTVRRDPRFPPTERDRRPYPRGDPPRRATPRARARVGAGPGPPCPRARAEPSDR